MEAHDWIELGLFVLAAASALIGSIRYIDSQISAMKLKIADRVSSVDRELADKLSIGEYNRRHEDLEKRIRVIERRMDYRNGMERYHSTEGDKYG